MTMCDPYDLEHPDCETTKMAKRLDYSRVIDYSHSKQTMPVDLNELPAYLSKAHRLFDFSDYPPITRTAKCIAEIEPPYAVKESRGDEDNVRPSRKMNKPKHSNGYYMGDIDLYTHGIPKGLKQKQEYDIGEVAMEISEAEREKEMGIRDFIKGCMEDTPEPVDAEKLAKEYGLEKVRLRRETDPRLAAFERRERVLAVRNRDHDMLKKYLQQKIEEHLEFATNKGEMFCEMYDIADCDPSYASGFKTRMPTDPERDIVLTELFDEYRELGYVIESHTISKITPEMPEGTQITKYWWKAGVTFKWGEETEESEDVAAESPVMSEETIQWIDIEKMQPPKCVSLYLVKYRNVDGFENINIYWWDSDNDDKEWRFNVTPLAGLKIIAWSNIPISRKPE